MSGAAALRLTLILWMALLAVSATLLVVGLVAHIDNLTLAGFSFFIAGGVARAPIIEYRRFREIRQTVSGTPTRRSIRTAMSIAWMSVSIALLIVLGLVALRVPATLIPFALGAVVGAAEGVAMNRVILGNPSKVVDAVD